MIFNYFVLNYEIIYNTNIKKSNPRITMILLGCFTVSQYQYYHHLIELLILQCQ